MFEELRAIIVHRVDALAVGERFNLRDLLGDHWPNDQGAARQLGRDFRSHLDYFPMLEDEGRDGENLRWYRRT